MWWGRKLFIFNDNFVPREKSNHGEKKREKKRRSLPSTQHFT